MAHTERAHSLIGPSAAHRWIACPASVRESVGEENHSSSFAMEGTAAHEFVEHIVKTGHSPARYEGGIVNLNEDKDRQGYRIATAQEGQPEPDDYSIWPINSEMIEAAVMYRDFLHERADKGSIIYLETRLDIRHVHPNMFGTGDALIFSPARKHLIVADFKYGRGLAVDVEDNEQCLTYGVGALKMFAGFDIRTVELAIIQPRAFHRQGPIRTQVLDVLHVEVFEHELRIHARRTDDPDAPYSAGEHCRFCPSAYRCQTLRDKVADIIGARDMTKIRSERDLPKVDKLSKDDIGEIMIGLPIVESFLRRVAEKANRDARNGKVPTGMKPVAARTIRRLRRKDDLAMELAIMGHDEADFMKPAELRGITAIEALVGKKAMADDFKQFVVAESKGIVLAPITDPRPDVRLTDPSEVFGAVSE